MIKVLDRQMGNWLDIPPFAGIEVHPTPLLIFFRGKPPCGEYRLPQKEAS
jgi:hypothetical protein